MPTLDEINRSELQDMGYLSGFDATKAGGPSFTDSFNALYRAESFTHSLLTGFVDEKNFPTRAEESAAWAAGYNPEDSIAEQLRMYPDSPWQDDTESLLRLGTARTPLHFERELGFIEDTFTDRAIIEQTPLPLVLAQSIGIGITDPAAWAVGGALSSGIMAGRTAFAASKVARMGASKTYIELGEQYAHQQRYLFKNPWTSTGKARQAKQLDDLAETEKLILAENAQMEAVINKARVHNVSSFAAIAGVEVAATEFALMDQPGRTVNEAIFNMLGSVALSGLLAAGGKMYNTHVRDPMIRELEESYDALSIAVEERKARAGFLLATNGTDSVNPIGAVDSPRSASEQPTQTVFQFLDENAGGLDTPTVVDDLELEDLRLTTQEADPDKLIDGAYVTVTLNEIEVPTATLKGLRVEDAYATGDEGLMISVNQEGEAFLTQGDLSKVEGDTVVVEIEYLNGGERVEGAFKLETVADQLGYDPSLAPRGDNGPVYHGPELGVLNKEADDQLLLDFKIGTDEADMAGYIDARGKASKDYTGAAALGSIPLIHRLHPTLRGMTSELNTVRDLTRLLTEHDYMEAGAHMDGRVRDTRAVETLIKLDERTAVSDLRTILNEGMLRLNKAGLSGENSLLEWQRKNVTGRSSGFREMQEQLVRYINDPKGYNPEGAFAAPEVRSVIEEIAGRLHKDIFKPWEELQLKQGMLNEAVTPEGMAFYMQRVWDMDKVNKGQAELHKILTDEFYTARHKFYLDQAVKKHKDAKGSVEGVPTEITPGRQKLALDQARAEATDFIESIRGDQLHIAEVERFNAKPGSLKARNNIASAKVMEFLSMDLGRNTAAWVKNVSPEVRLREKFGKEYTKHFKDAVNREVSERLDALSTLKARHKEGSRQAKAYDKEIKKITKAAKKANVDLGGMVDVMRNRYGVPKDPDSKLYDATKIMRAVNFVTKLGGMAVSSLVDPAYLIMKVGWVPALKAMGKGAGGMPQMSLGKGWRQLESDYRSRGTAEFREYRNDAHILHTVAELEGHSRVEQMAQLEDPTELGNAVSEGVAQTTNLFSKLTGMSRWNDWMKSVSHMAYTLKIEDAIRKGGQRNIDFLADMGIDGRMAGMISKQIEAKGVKQTGDMGAGSVEFTAPNIREWHRNADGSPDLEGLEAQQLMQAALTRAVDTTVVTPGAGDLPLMMRHPIGKLVAQFQAFPISILSRVVLPAVQRAGTGDWRQVVNMWTAIAAGTSVYALKAQLNGQEISDDPRRLLIEGLERSGIFGIYFNGATLANELTQGKLAEALLGDDYEAGFMSRDPIMDAATVSWRTGIDTQTALRGIATKFLTGEDMTWSQGSAIRRLIIGNNLFYAKQGSVWIQDFLMSAEPPE